MDQLQQQLADMQRQLTEQQRQIGIGRDHPVPALKSHLAEGEPEA